MGADQYISSKLPALKISIYTFTHATLDHVSCEVNAL